MNVKDLVVLQYAFNECYVQVVSVQRAIKESRLAINTDNETWGDGIEIGKGLLRASYQGRDGVIGVYDRRNLKHLDQMVHDAVEGTREPAPFSDD